MVSLPVVARHLLAGPNRPQRVEFHPPAVEAHVRIRLARVVNVPEVGPSAGGIECGAVAELHDHDAGTAARPPAGLALGDEFAAQLAQLPPGGKGREREQAPPLDAATADSEVEGVQAGEL